MQFFCFSLQYCDSYAFRERGHRPRNEAERITQKLLPDMSGTSRPDVHRCSICGELLAKWDEALTGLVVKKRKYDIAVTYDGVEVVSERFRSVCESHRLAGLTFRQLPDDPAFFAIRPTNVVAFDTVRRKTRFVNPCATCGQHKAVVGATPVFLKVGSVIGPLEFARTDVEFGNDDGKHPLLLCGQASADALTKAKLSGLDLELFDD
jgi:hypothetical protein